jgi:alkanesulfonate monooxygenase SsuD/methylene tetrahydromethanopterin reductase-like flavin-dependent oxidoreductase (luciferase family)
MIPGGEPRARLGLCLSEFPVDDEGRWRNVGEVVRRVEASGADGLWLADHVLWHSKAIDALSSLPALASHAERLTVGSCVLQLPLRDPISVAKTMANAQMMAPGRVVCGVGIGENVDEYTALGRSMASRGKVMDASIDELRRLWAIRDGNRWMNPEPDHIPVWVGGRAEVARRRAARTGDGWLPYLCSPRWFGRHRALLEEEAASAGRDPATITKAVVAFVDIDSVRSDSQGADKLEHLFGFDPTPLVGFLYRGTADEVAESLAAYTDVGATEILVVVANDRSLDVLDELSPAFDAALARRNA